MTERSHFGKKSQPSGPGLTQGHQELTGTAFYWLSTTKYQPLLFYTDQENSFVTP